MDRLFNLQGGGYGFLFRSDNTRVRILIFFVAQNAKFFPEFNIRLYDKNSESDYFFFLHQNQNIFFSNIGNRNIFFRKKTITLSCKLNDRSLRVVISIKLFLYWYKHEVQH